MLAAGQEQQYEQCSPLCLPYKQYYTQHPRCQFSCIMPEKRQSWYFRKQMIVTEVICQAQIQRPAVLRGPQWFSSATHVGTPLRKVTNVRWNWNVKNGEFPKDYYSFSSLTPPFPLLKWNAQFPHQKQSDWAAQHRPEWRSQPPYAEAPTGCAWGTFHFTHTWAWIGQAAAGPQALYAMQGMQQQAVTPCWVPGWCDLSVWCSQQQSTNQRLWSYSGAREPPLQLHVTHSPFWQTTKPRILPFFPTPLRNTGDPTQRFNIWQIWKKTAASLPKDELHICFKSCMQNQDYFFFWLRNKLSTVASALPRCSLCRLLTQQQWASPEWANMQVLSLSAWFSFPSFF